MNKEIVLRDVTEDKKSLPCTYIVRDSTNRGSASKENRETKDKWDNRENADCWDKSENNQENKHDLRRKSTEAAENNKKRLKTVRSLEERS
jgi:hypothetical protein